MIDTHLHVLPAIDDGAGNLREARAMLEQLASIGFTRVVATPHLMMTLSREYRLATTNALELITPIASAYGLDMDMGYEHLLTPDLARRLSEGESSTLAESSAVMVELPFIGWPRHTESSLFDLRLAGFRPVLAHPERYVEVQSNPERALAVAQQGVVLQLTFASFAGLYGRVAERTARLLLERGVLQDALIVFATDAHSDGRRLSSVPEGISRIRRKIKNGGPIVEWASQVVPAHLLASEPAPTFNQWLVDQGRQEPVGSTPHANGQGGVRGLRRPFGRGSRYRST